MSRRRSDGFLMDLREIFLATPWWMCLPTALAAFLLFTYVFPAILSKSEYTKLLIPLAPSIAPWAVAIIVLMGVAAWVKKWSKGWLLDRQRGLGTIESLTWQQFEEIVGAAYRRQGYKVVETGGGGPDGGIDLILRGNGEKVLVQCKQWRSYRVGVKLLREFHGILTSSKTTADRGIFVTFGLYTQEARQFARDNSIELVDRERLLEMVQAAQKGSKSAAEAAPHISVSDDDAGSPKPSEHTCPLCGQPMVLRTARRGTHAGTQFWGCTGYPKCRGTVPHSSA